MVVAQKAHDAKVVENGNKTPDLACDKMMLELEDLSRMVVSSSSALEADTVERKKEGTLLE
jgi:hypothetical protein